MSFTIIFLYALIPILTVMVLLWVVSIITTNVSIVDIFWGFGFALTASTYYYFTEGNSQRQLLVLVLVLIWGLRLSIYLGWRNIGKAEDFRYQEFRKKYGANRYWWVSFFQTFLLQGILMWLISLPILAAMYYGTDQGLGWIESSLTSRNELRNSLSGGKLASIAAIGIASFEPSLGVVIGPKRDANPLPRCFCFFLLVI